VTAGRTLLGGLLAGALLAGVPARSLVAQREHVVPAGTVVPIRFLGGVVSGREQPGARVVVQTMAALAVDSCVLVAPFRDVLGRVTVSRGPRRGGGAGTLDLRFDTLVIDRTHRLPMDAILDSLEYAIPRDILDSGLVVGGGGPLARPAAPFALTAVAAAGEVLILPVALLAGIDLLRRGPKVRIVPGEIGTLRLRSPMVVRGACTSPEAHPLLTALPDLPRFVPRAENRAGAPSGDPINIVLLGSGAEVAAAFRQAGWQAAMAPTAGALTREITAMLLSRNAYEAPVSTEYFEGRRQDFAFQLQGPTVRVRHHLRIWRLDSAAGVWVGAAIKDVGVLIRPLSGTATHRVDPDADAERDFTVAALAAAGCAHLLDYITLPGAPLRGRTVSRQSFFTDGRTAVVRMRPCDEPETR
jgi:hypothetical protein